MNTTINITSWLNASAGHFPTGYNPNLPSECWILKDGHYSMECIYKSVCQSLDSWIVKTGLVILISFIFLQWFLWWFMNYGYKYIPDYSDNELLVKIFGHIHEKDTRIWWDYFIRHRLNKVMLGYIAVVVFLQWQ